MIVGATTESDKDILYLSSSLYQHPTMRRVYYSGYISVNTYDKRLPALNSRMVRETVVSSRLAVTFYQFKVEEIVDDSYPDLDLEIEPQIRLGITASRTISYRYKPGRLRNDSQSTGYRNQIRQDKSSRHAASQNWIL